MVKSPNYSQNYVNKMRERLGMDPFSSEQDYNNYYTGLGQNKRAWDEYMMKRKQEEQLKRQLEYKRLTEQMEAESKPKNLMDMLEEETPEKDNGPGFIGKTMDGVGDFFQDFQFGKLGKGVKDFAGDAKDLVWNDRDGDGKKIDDIFGNLLDGSKRGMSKTVNAAGFNVLDNIIGKLPDKVDLPFTDKDWNWKNTQIGVPFAPGLSISPNDIVDSAKKSDNKAQKGLDFANEMLGMALPGMGAYKAVKGLGMGAKANTIGQRAKEGATASGLFAAADAGLTEGFAPEERTAQDHATRALLEIGLGAGLDVAAPLLQRILKRPSSARQTEPESSVNAASAGEETFRSKTPEYYESVLDKFAERVRGSYMPTNNNREALEGLWRQFAPNEGVSLEDAFRIVANKYNPKISAVKNNDPFDFVNRADNNQPFREAPEGSQTSSSSGAPLGVTAQTIDPYQTSPIAGAQSFRKRVQQGRASLRDSWQRFKENHLSDLQVAKDVEETIRGVNMHHSYDWRGRKRDGGIEADQSWYKGLRAARRAQSMARYAVDNGIRPIVRSLQENNISQIDFEEYALAKHADEVLRRDPDYEFPPSVNREWIDRTLQRWEGNEAMMNAQQNLVNFNRQMLQRRVESGIYSQETVDRMIRENPNYVSLARDIESFQNTIGSGGNITRSQQDIRRRRGGSEDDVLSPLDTSIRNAYITIANAEKNLAMQRIRQLSNLDRNNQFFREMRPNESAEGRPVVSFFENGNRIRYEVDPAVYRMSQLLDEKQLHSALKGFSEANKLLRKGATQYNYKFILRSMLRDPQTAMVTSRTGMNPMDLANAWLDTLFGRQLEQITNGRFRSYRDIYERNGGLYSGLISMDNQSLGKAVKEISRPRLGFRHLNPFHYVGKVGEAAEHVPKLAEFRSAKRKGLSDEDAMFEAVDVIDYSDAGAVSRDINKVVTFYNAAIRGNKRLIDAFNENPARATRNAIAAVSVPTAMAYFSRYAPGVSADQREKLEQLNDWEKNMFWHIPIPGTEEIMAVPKAHVIGQTFANPIERTFDFIKTSNPEAFEGMMTDLAKSLMPPTGMAAVKPFVEVLTNHKFFLDGAEVVNREMAAKPKEDQHDVYTSEVAKSLGEKTGQSPLQIDHLLKGLTGGAGEQALDVVDWFSSLQGKRPEKPSRNPLADVYLRDPLRGSGDTQDIFSAYNDLNNEKSAQRSKIKDEIRKQYPGITNKELTKMLREGYEYTNKDKLDLAKQMTDEFKLISQQINNIRMSDRYSGDQKAEMIKKLRERERQLNLLIKKKGLNNLIK